jgi:hypothetical protein
MGVGLNNFLGFIPLWILFLMTTGLIYASLVVGFKLGSKAVNEHDSATSTPPLGSVVTAMLGLLAFMLALTFSSAAGRHETRKALLLDDVDAISSVYSRSDFLSREDGILMKEKLKRYVELRLEVAANPSELYDVIGSSNALQYQMWDIIKTYPKEGVSPLVSVKVMESIEEMFRVQNRRVVQSSQYHIHPSIWLALLGVGILSLGALGFQFGISGGRRYQVSLLLAICFSVILSLIVDLDRAGEGTIKVDQKPLEQFLLSISKR